MATDHKPSDYFAAVISGVAANVILGASSLFWKALSAIPPVTLLGYRIFLSLVTLMVVMGLLRRYREMGEKLTSRNVAIHGIAAVLVAVNWGTFIWASIQGHVIESGLGYLIAPFVAIGIGAFVLGEPMSWIRIGGLIAIAVCVVVLLHGSGELSEWVYLVIGVTWGGYACLKKFTSLDAFGGLLCETLVLGLVWLMLMLMPLMSMRLPEGLPGETLLLLASCGIVSVLPLWLFAKAAFRLPLSVMGFFQFVLPTTQLIVALAFYRQPMSLNTALCFGAIWLALMTIVAEPLLTRGLSALPTER